MISDKILAFYKKYISPLNPPCCRFYPTCSEYVAICFRFHNPLFATFKSIIRILKCNQLFKGGIEYPTIKVNIPHKILPYTHKVDKIKPIAFYLVAESANNFYIIKSLKDKN